MPNTTKLGVLNNWRRKGQNFSQYAINGKGWKDIETVKMCNINKGRTGRKGELKIFHRQKKKEKKKEVPKSRRVGTQ